MLSRLFKDGVVFQYISWCGWKLRSFQNECKPWRMYLVWLKTLEVGGWIRNFRNLTLKFYECCQYDIITWQTTKTPNTLVQSIYKPTSIVQSKHDTSILVMNLKSYESYCDNIFWKIMLIPSWRKNKELAKNFTTPMKVL